MEFLRPMVVSCHPNIWPKLRGVLMQIVHKYSDTSRSLRHGQVVRPAAPAAGQQAPPHPPLPNIPMNFTPRKTFTGFFTQRVTWSSTLRQPRPNSQPGGFINLDQTGQPQPKIDYTVWGQAPTPQAGQPTVTAVAFNPNDMGEDSMDVYIGGLGAPPPTTTSQSSLAKQPFSGPPHALRRISYSH